jgi:mRNA interferase MazF
MIREGHVVLFRFPQTDQTVGKLRPALVIRKLPGVHDDWLICMISSQMSQQIQNFDEVLNDNDNDFMLSGLKTSSVIRISRLAVVSRTVLLGSIGSIGTERLELIKNRLSNWIKST